jgi:hypothetical protein
MKNAMRNTLVACCVMLLAVPGFAEAGKRTNKVVKQQNSKLDVYAGYSYWAPHGSVNNFRYKALNEGFTVSAAYYMNPYLGAQFEFQRGQQTANDGMRSFSGGLIARDPRVQGMVPFAHALLGTIGLTGPNEASIGNGSSYLYNPEHWGVLLTAGGGVDYATPFLHGHLRLRIFQVDYQYAHVNFGPPLATQGGRANLKAVHLSTGIVYSFNSLPHWW